MGDIGSRCNELFDRYELADNVLKLSFSCPLVLKNQADVDVMLGAFLHRISRCPKTPYLLVDYAGLSLHPEVAAYHETCFARVEDAVLDVFAYRLTQRVPARVGSWTPRAVLAGTEGLPSLFSDERSARTAVRATIAMASEQSSSGVWACAEPATGVSAEGDDLRTLLGLSR